MSAADVRHLVVRVGEARAALPARAVRQVLRGPAIAPLPGGRGAVAGLIEFGGEPLALLDLARLLGAKSSTAVAPAAVVVRLPGAGGTASEPDDEREHVELVAIGVDEALEVVVLSDERTHRGQPVHLVDLARIGSVS